LWVWARERRVEAGYEAGYEAGQKRAGWHGEGLLCRQGDTEKRRVKAYSVSAVANLVYDAEQVISLEGLVEGAELVENAAKCLWCRAGKKRKKHLSAPFPNIVAGWSSSCGLWLWFVHIVRRTQTSDLELYGVSWHTSGLR
jgi:hypothetical protein